MYGYLPPDLFENVVEFVTGGYEYRKRLNAVRKIQKWYRKYSSRDDNGDYDKQIFLRQFVREYTLEMALIYPLLAKNKIALYMSDHIGELPQFTKKSEVVSWVIENLNETQISLVGF